ncbi:transcriptional regulator [Solibacillus sp. MA9]|uniref:Transcriptional regulator n=1 Tax=Solibacillus palustris TaxID=2908203 RepID=A0ABS9UFJ1_9BACL|nr:transcriptional regulator [Solibacillus sp. MA9]MCH7323091.1 transcriptional regulator [Solibacillus sp. MA9]
MTNHNTLYTSQSLVAIISPEMMLPAIKESLRGFPSIQAQYFILHDSLLTEELITFITQYEMLVIADPFIYQQLKNYDSSLKLYQLNSRAIQLYQLLLTHQIKKQEKSYSFDFMQESDILAITHQLHQKIDYVFSTDVAIEQIVENHISYAKQGYHPVTTVAAVHEKLRSLNLASDYLIPTKQEMIVAFERVLLASKSRQNKETQIVYGIIQFEAIASQDYSKVKQILQQFSQQMDGHLITLNPLQYSFITTRGQFERETLGYKHLPLLSQFKEELHINCTIGIGFGINAYESGRHAKQALYQANDNGPNVCYIVREDSRVIGPIDTTVFINYEQYPLAITDLQLLERAEKAGMSASYISKLMGRITKHQKYIYTAEELAQTLNITLRSANRILLKWLDAGLVDIIGEEKVAHRGRPKRIYFMQFLEELKNQ